MHYQVDILTGSSKAKRELMKSMEWSTWLKVVVYSMVDAVTGSSRMKQTVSQDVMNGMGLLGTYQLMVQYCDITICAGQYWGTL